MRKWWWPVRTVGERLQRRIDEVDAWIRAHAEAAAPGDRDEHWHATVNELLGKRASLVQQQKLGFMITDRRKVRG